MKKTALLLASLALVTQGVMANTVTSDACTAGARDFTVSATNVVGCLQVGAGNINGNQDVFQTSHPGWSLADKSDAAGNLYEGWLTITGVGGTSGTFSINSAAYSTYDNIAIGFKVGEGQLDPDWAVFAFADGALSGTWSVSGKQSLSHANLYGFGTVSSARIAELPEPGSFALLGLGLAGLAFTRKRKLCRQ
jgi:hypothetical protein